MRHPTKSQHGAQLCRYAPKNFVQNYRPAAACCTALLSSSVHPSPTPLSNQLRPPARRPPTVPPTAHLTIAASGLSYSFLFMSGVTGCHVSSGPPYGRHSCGGERDPAAGMVVG